MKSKLRKTIQFSERRLLKESENRLDNIRLGGGLCV